MIASIGGKKIHYQDEGTGKTVVLLHGYLESISMWSRLSSVLSKQYRVVCIDLPGHGESDNLHEDLSIDHMANLVNGLVNHLAIKKAMFIGHSMGGYVGLSLLNNFPNLVEKLILFHSKASNDSPEIKLKRDQGIKMLEQHPSLYIKESINNLFWQETKSSFSKDISSLVNEAKKRNSKGYIEAMIAMKNRPDRRFLLNEKDNIIYIAGKHDPVISIDLSLLEMELIKENYQFTLEKSGHMGFIEEKEMCEKMIIIGLRS